MPAGAPLPLDAAARRNKALALGLATGAAIVLAALDVGALPLRIRSCPFLWLTGLPCPLCGLTRAMHHLLRCDFAMAWYLNPLAFPVGAVAVALFSRAAFEIATGRRACPLPIVRASWFIALAALLLLHWTLHVHGAVKTPKPELLRAHAGPWPLMDADPHGSGRQRGASGALIGSGHGDCAP